MKRIILPSAFLLTLLVLVSHSNGNRKAIIEKEIMEQNDIAPSVVKTEPAGVRFFSASHAGN